MKYIDQENSNLFLGDVQVARIKKKRVSDESKMEVELFKSKTWLRWLELREKTFHELSKEERAEYRKLKPMVCKELTKLQTYTKRRKEVKIPKNKRGEK